MSTYRSEDALDLTLRVHRIPVSHPEKYLVVGPALSLSSAAATQHLALWR